MVYDGLEDFKLDERLAEFVTLLYYTYICSSTSKHNSAIKKEIIKQLSVSGTCTHSLSDIKGN